MLTDSTGLLFDLTCQEDVLSDDSGLCLQQENKENLHPFLLQGVSGDDFLWKGAEKRATHEGTLLHDSRVLQGLLNAEDNFISYPSTYKFQEDLKPHMRRTVAQWMLDVSGWDGECEWRMGLVGVMGVVGGTRGGWVLDVRRWDGERDWWIRGWQLMLEKGLI